MAGRRFFAIVGVGILTALAQMAGALACGIGIIAPVTFFAVAVPALILEGVGVTAAMGRSFTLTKTHFWRVLGLYVAAHLLGFIVNIGLAVGLAAGFRHGDSATTLVISQGIASAIATVLTTPFVATAIVACYFDLRIRDEGFDIQLMLQRLNAKYAPPPPPPPPPPPQPAYVQ
jgi:hypothetical protein